MHRLEYIKVIMKLQKKSTRIYALLQLLEEDFVQKSDYDADLLLKNLPYIMLNYGPSSRMSNSIITNVRCE